MQIEERAFLVTGGASGLGEATARRLVASGANVILADLSEERGAALANEHGPRARFVCTNVASEASAQVAVSSALDCWGALHGLVNCAGVAPAEKVLGRDGPHPLDGFIRTVNVNLVGTFNMLRLAAAAMAKNVPDDGGERGVIVNTASVAAFDGQVGQAAYAATKGAIVSMTLPIARELAREGIRVMTIAPGIMSTQMVRAMPADVQMSLGRMIPSPPRLGEPDEFAKLVAHIVDNRYLNGDVIRLDGAVRMAAK